MKHPKTPPSGYAVIEVHYGAEYKHLYSTSEDEVEYHPTHDAAMAAARKAAAEDANAMFAVMKITEIVAAKAEPTIVSSASGRR